MKSLDKIFFGFMIGFTFPFLLCLLSGIVWFYVDKNESRVLIYLITGLLLGLLIDMKFLRNWINIRYELSIWFIIFIYLVYNIGLYGFFMGFPVFNVFFGIIAGYYSGKRICFSKIKSEKHSKLINLVSLFTGLIMTLICISSGFLALSGNGAGDDIKGMLGLGFDVTKSMVWGITLIGGVSLILAQILLTRITIVKTIKISTRRFTET
jgi:hypothetical protein